MQIIRTNRTADPTNNGMAAGHGCMDTSRAGTRVTGIIRTSSSCIRYASNASNSKWYATNATYNVRKLYT